MIKESLIFHLREVLEGRRRFETAAESVSRMIISAGVNKFRKAGRTIIDYQFFRQGERHVIGWYDELNELVNFVMDAAEGGISKEMAFVLIGEPGNGKTFVVQYLCDKYRGFLSLSENRRYTFEFINLDQLGEYGRIKVVQSQTFEDPIILAMNLFDSREESKEFLARIGFDDKTIDSFFKKYRPLGACTDYILNDIREYCNYDLDKMLEFIRVVPVRVREEQDSGVVTTKYSAGDKITSSAKDLVGEESLRGEMQLNHANPYRYDIKKGALARCAGGGIHFADEVFKNKPDLLNIYLQAIQSRTIELEGYKWPIDTLIIATSNTAEYHTFISQPEHAPQKDRFRACYVPHNTDYKLQFELTRYALGEQSKKSYAGKVIHRDPNLNYVLSTCVVLTRLPKSDRLSPVDIMKLEAGEIAGEKSVKELLEIKEEINSNPDATRRWGQQGIGHRGLGRIIQSLLSLPETHEGECMFAGDVFKAVRREAINNISEGLLRDKVMADIEVAEGLYREKIYISVYNAFMEDPQATQKDVMAYVNMIIALGSEKLGPDKVWTYRDPQTGQLKTIKVDERYIDAIETRLGLNSKEAKDEFRNNIRKVYAQRLQEGDFNYDFMDQERLVKAVTEVRIESDIAGAGSLVGALANRANEENKRLYNRMIKTMVEKLGYCNTCAERTIEVFCEKKG